jgi:hypothetical protein
LNSMKSLMQNDVDKAEELLKRATEAVSTRKDFAKRLAVDAKTVKKLRVAADRAGISKYLLNEPRDVTLRNIHQNEEILSNLKLSKQGAYQELEVRKRILLILKVD